MKHSLVTSDKAKQRGWVGFERIPTPPDHESYNQAQLEAYVISYISDLPIHDLMLMITSPKRKKFIYLMADPKNIDKNPEDLWVQAGYANLGKLPAAMTCPITNTCITRLRQNNMKANLKCNAGIIEPDDILNILSNIVSTAKVSLADGKSWGMKNQHIYMRALELMMKANNMLDNRVKIDGDIKLEIKLPEQESPQLTDNTFPLKEINAEVIDTEVNEDDK